MSTLDNLGPRRCSYCLYPLTGGRQAFVYRNYGQLKIDVLVCGLCAAVHQGFKACSVCGAPISAIPRSARTKASCRSLR